MSELSYTAAISHTVYDLESASMFAGTASALRSSEWNRTLALNTITQLNRKSREVNVPLQVTNWEQFDQLLMDAQADVQQNTPGRLTARTTSGDEWVAQAYLLANDPQAINPMEDSNTQLTFGILGGVWGKETTFKLLPRDTTGKQTTGVDYPHDFPIDYGSLVSSTVVRNQMRSPMPVRIRFFGPITNPYVAVAGNTYQVNMEVPAGAYVTVEPLGQKSVIMTTSAGVQSNVFSHAVLSGGLNSGQYIFQPLPSGEYTASWANTFDVEFTVIEQRGEPAWK